MDLSNITSMTPSELEHAGVKGMKWGKRKSDSSGGDKVQKAKTPKEPGRFKKGIASNKREAMLYKDLRDVSKMSDTEIKNKTKRMQDENSLSRLTKEGRFETKANRAKRDMYLDRAKLSDVELKVKVDRLQLESNLKSQVKAANKDKVKAANEVIKMVSSLALSQYTTNGNFSATGNALADSLISSALKETKKGNTIRQSGVDDMHINELLAMTPSELEHSGVKGMKWGKRKAAQYSSASKTHEAKTKQRRTDKAASSKEEHDKAKAIWVNGAKKYSSASKTHEAKTKQRRTDKAASSKEEHDKAKAIWVNGAKKYSAASKTHEAKTKQRRTDKAASSKEEHDKAKATWVKGAKDVQKLINKHRKRTI